MDVLLRVRQALDRLSASERRVAETVLADPDALRTSTIMGLAQASGASQSTVARFCQSLGYPGFREFRLEVATALSRDEAQLVRFDIAGGEITPGDTVTDIIAKIAFQEVQAIEDTAQFLDTEAVTRAVEAIRRATRIELYGAGSSSLTAQDLHQKLSRIGKPAGVAVDVHLALVQAALLGEGSVAIGVSFRGETRETLDFLAAARDAGAVTVGITNAAASSLDDVCDIVLRTSVRESRYRSGAMASRIAQLALVDMLFVLVLQQDFPQMTERLRRTYDAVSSRRPGRSAGEHG
ncbi:MurR/RpiR family transcriptional regulator [Microbacterium sp. zg.Y625]|uniref:MurR/RpiR family transcriptional regulator n=1 Tax=Microbacterium jiangjiandongii TaxID=3049071 RepID=UPI00214C29E2|nr:MULTISPECIES: MurR/RpiR family transcriptional regulator [unclassified Microbacterium]MCR2793447.1 MurR/RpiR family transcriptional regulator [Microbacterium sp. zg.Y625]MCR2815375.1 MurR/RpiR family transcriptional regulator [Microbacterium sp. zg.Y843]WIM25182.1 MurR/RpiR family transcriptional regulator [Microbacterium sp. zg-Y625]